VRLHAIRELVAEAPMITRRWPENRGSVQFLLEFRWFAVSRLSLCLRDVLLFPAATRALASNGRLVSMKKQFNYLYYRGGPPAKADICRAHKNDSLGARTSHMG
jgi:hypothetical protein